MKTIVQYMNDNQFQDCEYWKDNETISTTRIDPQYLDVIQNTDARIGGYMEQIAIGTYESPSGRRMREKREAEMWKTEQHVRDFFAQKSY